MFTSQPIGKYDLSILADQKCAEYFSSGQHFEVDHEINLLNFFELIAEKYFLDCQGFTVSFLALNWGYILIFVYLFHFWLELKITMIINVELAFLEWKSSVFVDFEVAFLFSWCWLFFYEWFLWSFMDGLNDLWGLTFAWFIRFL